MIIMTPVCQAIGHYLPLTGWRISGLKALADEFGVSERTLQRDFHNA